MSRRICVCLLALAATCASTVLASAQVTSSQTTDNQVLATSTPVAYVYVSSFPSANKGQINAYSASTTGALTRVTGSPFPSPVAYMALNGRWLFGTNGIDIDSYAIASNGSLKLVDTYTAGNSGGGPGVLFLDHSGASLYDGFINLNGTGNNGYQSYSINQTTGKISFINNIAGGPSIGSVLSFVSNNTFAYSSSCYHFAPSIFGVKRGGDGSITELTNNFPLPVPPTGNYCPFLAAADPAGHLAIAMQPFKDFGTPSGPFQLATYTVNNSGGLTTNSTAKNMPSVAVGDVIDYWMSPNGKFLAVGGSAGLQVFHFNGANPITKYTGLLTTSPIAQLFWDNANHLYALSTSAGKLYVFTVTATSVTQAPGSPHSITNPQNVIVLPKT
jgi:hypothetical protein